MSMTGATWSTERVEALKRCFDAGLSCSQIAREIGVTRNAVIGKVSRLGLSRPPGAIATPPRRARLSGPRRTRRLRMNVFVQQDILKTAFVEAEPRVDAIPIHNGRGCTLFELDRENCRWPIMSKDGEELRYCGNGPIAGSSYCPAHARIAYRPGGRRASSG